LEIPERRRQSVPSASKGHVYPLKFRPLVLDKVWGGRQLESVFGKKLPGKKPIGEIWSVWDGLRIANGPDRGETLKNVVRQDPVAWLGHSSSDPAFESFPLLVKLLDAQENLSVQVHPDDDYARQREGQPFGKCEMWYIVAAEPGATVIHGPRSTLSPRELRTAIESGRLVDELERVEVAAGDVLLNRPGTIHALGGGIVLYELQQSCDLTYRLYDWDRGRSGAKPRELHVERGVEVSDLRPLTVHKIPSIRLVEADHERTLLCACRYFAAELLVPWVETLRLRTKGRFDLLTVLDGKLAVRCGSSSATRPALGPGDSALIPATGGEYSLVVSAQPVRVIRAYAPNLATDVIEPLRARGIESERISKLGGDSDRSDLGELLA
jgi:mannose-6-phosphate isomerase